MMRAASTSPQRTRSSIVNFLCARISQKIDEVLVELVSPFEIRNVTGIFDHDQTRARNRVMHFLAVGNRRYRVVTPNKNQSWRRDLREQRRLVLSFCHSQ